MQNKNRKFERKEFDSLENEYEYLCKRVENLADKNNVIGEVYVSLGGYPTNLINIHGLNRESWMLVNNGDGTVSIKKPWESTWKSYSASSKLIEFIEEWIKDYDSRARPELLEALKIYGNLKSHVPSDIELKVSYDGLVTLSLHGPRDFHETFDHTDIESDIRLIKFYSDTLHGESRAYRMARDAEMALHEKVKAIFMANGLDFEISCLEDYTINVTDANGTKVDVTDIF